MTSKCNQLYLHAFLKSKIFIGILDASLARNNFLQSYLAIPTCFPTNVKVPIISSAQIIAEYNNFYFSNIHSNLLITN